MDYKLVIAACAVGLILTQVFIHEYKRDPNEYTELNFVFVKKEAVINGEYIIQFENPVKTKERVFSYNNEFYTILEHNDDTVLLAKYPKTIEKNQEFSFSFEITNRLGEIWTYTYFISVNEEVVKENTIAVSNKEKKLIKEELRIPSMGTAKLSVRLSTGEEIYFYVEVE
ncbi:MAG: hypothetical protein U9N35_02670 [Euryarchaeota archaeon]|nr:hypothetical protein [Euryarchaeota archaeon]